MVKINKFHNGYIVTIKTIELDREYYYQDLETANKIANHFKKEIKAGKIK